MATGHSYPQIIQIIDFLLWWNLKGHRCMPYLYLQSVNAEENVLIWLLCSKSRICTCQNSFTNNSIHLWIDSTICMAWISAPSLKCGNMFIPQSCWSYIRMYRNWWCGPEWLSLWFSSWPQFESHVNKEIHSTPFNKFSITHKLRKVTAYCKRFINNSHGKK